MERLVDVIAARARADLGTWVERECPLPLTDDEDGAPVRLVARVRSALEYEDHMALLREGRAWDAKFRIVRDCLRVSHGGQPGAALVCDGDEATVRNEWRGGWLELLVDVVTDLEDVRDLEAEKKASSATVTG